MAEIIRVEHVWMNVKCFQCDEDIIFEGEDHLVECKCKCKTRVFFKKDIEYQDKYSLPQRTLLFNNDNRNILEWLEKGFQRGYWLVSDYYELKEMVLSEKQSI